MSAFTKTLIVDGVGGGSSLADNFCDNTTSGWENGPNGTWVFDNTNHTATCTDASTLDDKIFTKQSLSVTQYEYYILRYTVDYASDVSGVLRIGGPFGEESLTSTLGSHEYRFQCTEFNPSKLYFEIVQNQSITLSSFSFKQEGINGVYSSIKTAVDALGETGGSVIVEQGEYIFDGFGEQTTIDLPHNCSLIASGNAVISVKADIPLFRTFNVSRATISDFIIMLKVATSSLVKLISLKGASACILERLKISVDPTISTTGYAAIALEEFYDSSTYIPSYGNVISHCSINRFDYGISLYGNDSSRQNCYENMVDGNDLCDCGSAIQLEYAHNNIISNNRVYNDSTSVSTCIHVYQSDLNVVTGNVCTVGSGQTIDDGILLEQSNNCSVTGNICNKTGNGIRIRGIQTEAAKYNTITGNIYKNDSTSGIYMGYYLHGYAQYNVLEGNICYTNAVNAIGINEDNATSGAEYNLFTDNVVKNDATGGIAVQLGEGTLSIESNTVKD